jgi:GNAT superfamily N-acetyltransferase
MIKIIRPSIEHAKILSEIGSKSFIESHGSSAPEKDIQNYVAMYFNEPLFEKELADLSNIYFLVYVDERPAGYSKIRFNTSNPNVEELSVTKMDRLYVLKEYYDKGIGKQLFDLNLQFAKENQQKGFWLFVWTENLRAIKFYKRQGFINIGNTSFKISETHSNPNY